MVFFFKQKTAYEMRISDWSSDVCSSDLASVGYWPKSGIRGQFYVRLSKPRRDGAELRLTIGSRRFILTGNGVHGWASDRRMDAGIVAADRKSTRLNSSH